MLDVEPAVPDLLLDEGVGRASRPSALKELRIGPVGDLEPRSCSVYKSPLARAGEYRADKKYT